ncbi:MAG: response regulator transcription factor, partial [Spirochaetales bacterium]|nr:response regulator transcription factor [Spirochaetales bacterium]
KKLVDMGKAYYCYCSAERLEALRQKQENKPELSFESLSRYKISEREFTVVQLICEGLTNKEIAQELNISVNTVNNHVANIFSKMDVRSRIDLLKALKEGPWS